MTSDIEARPIGLEIIAKGMKEIGLSADDAEVKQAIAEGINQAHNFLNTRRPPFRH